MLCPGGGVAAGILRGSIGRTPQSSGGRDGGVSSGDCGLAARTHCTEDEPDLAHDGYALLEQGDGFARLCGGSENVLYEGVGTKYFGGIKGGFGDGDAVLQSCGMQ